MRRPHEYYARVHARWDQINPQTLGHLRPHQVLDDNRVNQPVVRSSNTVAIASNSNLMADISLLLWYVAGLGALLTLYEYYLLYKDVMLKEEQVYEYYLHKYAILPEEQSNNDSGKSDDGESQKKYEPDILITGCITEEASWVMMQ